MQLSTKILGESNSTTILFISGFVGSYETWDAHFLSLSEHYRLVLIDTLGFGQSPKPDIEYSIEDHVAAIHHTLQSHNVQRTHLVGHSMGCLLALAYANRYPERTGRMALLAFPAFDDEAQARHTVAHGSLFNRWLAMDTPLARMSCALMCALRPVLMPLAPYLVRHVPAIVAKDALRHHWKSYSRTLRNVLFRADSRRWMQQTHASILLIHGIHDVTAPYANVLDYQSLPNVRLITLDADHGLIFTHSGLIAHELATFFGERDSPKVLDEFASVRSASWPSRDPKQSDHDPAITGAGTS